MRCDDAKARACGSAAAPVRAGDRDIVDGRAGDDLISGEQVDGGDGDDHISGGRVVCGPGRDRLSVRGYDEGLRAPRDCELLAMWEWSLAIERTAVLRRRRLTVVLWADQLSVNQIFREPPPRRETVAGDISFDAGRGESRSRSIRIRFGPGSVRRRVSFTLSAARARQLRRTGWLRVRVSGSSPAKTRVRTQR